METNKKQAAELRFVDGHIWTNGKPCMGVLYDGLVIGEIYLVDNKEIEKCRYVAKDLRGKPLSKKVVLSKAKNAFITKAPMLLQSRKEYDAQEDKIIEEFQRLAKKNTKPRPLSRRDYELIQIRARKNILGKENGISR